MLEAIVRQQGFVVDTARDGEEAIAKLQKGLYDVILLDLMMPVMDGVAFADALREQETESPIPIIVISADSSPERAVAVGARGFLAKPFDIDALLAQVAANAS